MTDISADWGTPVKPSWLTDEIEAELKLRHFPVDKDGLMMLWQKHKELLAFYKDKEMELRKLVATTQVPDAKEGMNTVELGNGFELKVNKKYNYKLDSDNDKVWNGLAKIESLGNEGKFVAERLVSWTPNFLLTEYRQLQEDADKGSEFAKKALSAIAEFMTITEAAPTVDIKEPKKKK